MQNLSAYGELDHIIIGVGNLEEGIKRFAQLSGCRATIGGSHPNWGTRNALLHLDENCCLELLAPDPKQNGLRWHPEIATFREPKIVGWAVRHELDQFAALLYERGVPSIGPAKGSRVRQDGSILRWRTVILRDDLKGHLPFFIEWDTYSPHPSTDSPKGCSLREFRVTGALPEIPPLRAGMRLQPSTQEQTQLFAKFSAANGREFELASNPVRAAHWVI